MTGRVPCSIGPAARAWPAPWVPLAIGLDEADQPSPVPSLREDPA